MSRYSKHLKSPEWQALREFVLERDGHRCRTCGGNALDLHVHHVTYERMGEEWPDDLLTLCIRCHDALHQVGGCHRPVSQYTPVEEQIRILALALGGNVEAERVFRNHRPETFTNRSARAVALAFEKVRDNCEDVNEDNVGRHLCMDIPAWNLFCVIVEESKRKAVPA